MNNSRRRVQRGGHCRRRLAAPAGFTLLEMMLCVIIIAIIAGTLIPIVTRPLQVDQQWNTVKTMYSVVDSIMGRPDLGMSGFVGAMGRLPHAVGVNTTFAVDELMEGAGDANAASPVAAVQGGLSSGWVGPFLFSLYPNPGVDGWGTPYVLTTCVGTPGVTPGYAAGGLASGGCTVGSPPAPGSPWPLRWRISSNGPDRLPTTPDDIDLPDNRPNDYFTAIGAVTLDLKLARQGIVRTMPDSWLIGTTGVATPVTVTAYLPSTVDGSRVPCVVGTPNCPGACSIVDSSSPPVVAGPNTPMHVRCTGLPLGPQHVRVAAVDPDSGLTANVDTNVVVTMPESTSTIVLNQETIPQSLGPPVNVSLGTGSTSGYTFTSYAAPLSAASLLTKQLITGSAVTTATFPASGYFPANLAFHIQGTAQTLAANNTCTIMLSLPAPATTNVPVVLAFGAAGGELPFSIDYVYPSSVGGVAKPAFALSGVQVNLTAGSSGACTVLVPLVGSIERFYEP